MKCIYYSFIYYSHIKENDFMIKISLGFIIHNRIVNIKLIEYKKYFLRKIEIIINSLTIKIEVFNKC